MNDPNPLPAAVTVGAAPWYTSQVYIGAVVTVLSSLLSLAPKAASLLGLTTPASVEKLVEAVFQLVALAAGIYTVVKRQNSTIQPLTLTRAAAQAHATAQQSGNTTGQPGG